MSNRTELLRRAAKRMRCHDDSTDGYGKEFWAAFADLLDNEAERVEKANAVADFSFGRDAHQFYKQPKEAFCAVARSYLREEAGS